MIFQTFINFFIHLDKNLALIIQSYGTFTYVILFLIILCETGLVITPFLPGDSLIFVTGAFAGKGDINIYLIYILFLIAAILGDSLNYFIGNYFGEKVFAKSRFFKKEHLDKTKDFYKKHGGKTIIYARFIPIVRTFAPFVAGIGKMEYKKFLSYNIIGGIAWVTLFLFGGYFFGRIDWVEKNLTLLIYLIIGFSILPIIFEFFKAKISKRKKR